MTQKRPFLPLDMLSWEHIGLAGSIGALLVGWSVVVVHGLYLLNYIIGGATFCSIKSTGLPLIFTRLLKKIVTKHYIKFHKIP